MIKRLAIISSILILVVIVIFSVSSHAITIIDDDTPFVIGCVSLNSGFLNVRKEPNTDAEIIGNLYNGDQVIIFDKINGFYEIDFEFGIAYISSNFVKLINPDGSVPEEEIELKDSNISKLKVNYVVTLENKTEAYYLKGKKATTLYPGLLSVFRISGGYAYFAKDRTILKIKENDISNILPVRPYGDLCEEPIVCAYTTFFSESKTNRVNNIKLSSKAISVVLAPGSTFSFNEIVGKRTREKGYLSAGAFVNGETVQQIGGGICQVSSTVYAAVRQNALFQVIERFAHNPDVSYLPLGMDATVNWNNRDIKFINNYDCYIYITVQVDHGRITILLRKTPY